jgi:hypothetical protein
VSREHHHAHVQQRVPCALSTRAAARPPAGRQRLQLVYAASSSIKPDAVLLMGMW